MLTQQKEEKRMREEKRAQEDLKSYKTLFSAANVAETHETLQAKKTVTDYEDDFM